MIDKINNNQIPDILREGREALAKPTPRSQSAGGNNADASLQVSYELLLEQAKQEPVNDADIVERARRMVMSGELDRPENIRKAAEKLLKFGI